MSLRPGSEATEPPADTKGLSNSLGTCRPQSRPDPLQPAYIQVQLEAKDTNRKDGRPEDDTRWTAVSNGEDVALCSLPRTENEVRELLLSIGSIFSFWRCFTSILMKKDYNY